MKLNSNNYTKLDRNLIKALGQREANLLCHLISLSEMLGNRFWQQQHRLAESLNVSEKILRTDLKYLRSLGLVQIDKYHLNVYTLNEKLINSIVETGNLVPESNQVEPTRFPKVTNLVPEGNHLDRSKLDLTSEINKIDHLDRHDKQDDTSLLCKKEEKLHEAPSTQAYTDISLEEIVKAELAIPSTLKLHKTDIPLEKKVVQQSSTDIDLAKLNFALDKNNENVTCFVTRLICKDLNTDKIKKIKYLIPTEYFSSLRYDNLASNVSLNKSSIARVLVQDHKLLINSIAFAFSTTDNKLVYSKFY